MNRTLIIAALFALVFVAGQSALAQSGYDLFQKGLVQERAKGDLDEAIRLYQQIVEDHKDDRGLVAKALVQMGQCYEKLGRTEARKAYERVVKEFADQAEPMRIARAKLEQLDTGITGTAVGGPTYHLVLDEKIAGMPIERRPAFSPGGDRVVFESQDWYRLYITNQTGPGARPLLNDLGKWEYINCASWSPDGKLVAYRAIRSLSEDSESQVEMGMFIIDPDGGSPRQIGPNVKGRIRGRAFWMPDMRHMSYWTDDGLHTYNVSGKKLRSIPKKDLPRVLPWFCVYSPNGSWIVSRRRTGKKSSELCIFPASGGTVRRITDQPLAIRPEWGPRPTWAPDGRMLYFVVQENGDASNIWGIPMDVVTGLAMGEARQVTFFKGTAVSEPQMLGDASRMGFVTSRWINSIKVADASSPNEPRSLIYSGEYSPELSPDGKTVYYINDRTGDEGIYAVSREGSTPRRLTETLPVKGYPHAPLDLSPDGKTLAFCAELDNEYGLYTMSANGGRPRLLVRITNEEFNGAVPQWSPDGSSLAYATTKALYVIDGDGGKPLKLAPLEGYWGSCVRWSPDGKYIAGLGAVEPKSENAVLVVTASGGKPRQLTPVTEWLQRLEWHPDGKRLTYHVSQHNSETRQAYLDGRPPTVLLNAPGVWDYEGAWAPDGRRFFFVASGQSEPGGLYVYDEASGETEFVADRVGIVPSWSRDGKTMAWCATKRTGTQVWVMENFLPESKARD